MKDIEVNQHEGIYKEIAKGLKDKPAYLLIFGVCALFLLSGLGNSIAGIVSQDHILIAFGLISFIVALIASVIVVKHIENKEIYKDITDLPTKPDKTISNYFPPSIDYHLKKANEIWLIGIHQSHILIRYHQLIENKLKQGDIFRVLLLDPEGAACAMTAMRFPGEISVIHERERIMSSIRSFCALQKIAPERLEIRIIDFLLPYGGIVLDPNDSSGITYIQRYTFKTRGGAIKPKFVYKREDTQWYDLFWTEIQEFWKAADTWRCNDVK